MRTRRFQPRIDGLELRLPLANGISLGSNGLLALMAPLNSGNVGSISVNPENSNQYIVSLNGYMEVYDASQVTSVFYYGGMGGGDTFVNDTSLVGIEYGWGGNNTFYGGTGNDYFFLWGNGNVVHDAGGSVNAAYTHGGHDSIDVGVFVF